MEAAEHNQASGLKVMALSLFSIRNNGAPGFILGLADAIPGSYTESRTPYNTLTMAFYLGCLLVGYVASRAVFHRPQTH